MSRSSDPVADAIKLWCRYAESRDPASRVPRAEGIRRLQAWFVAFSDLSADEMVKCTAQNAPTAEEAGRIALAIEVAFVALTEDGRCVS